MAGKHKVTAMQAEKCCQRTQQIHIGHYFLSYKGQEFHQYRSALRCALWQSNLGEADRALLCSCLWHWEVLQYRKLGWFIVIQVVKRFTSRRHKTYDVFSNFLPPQFLKFARFLSINITINFLHNSYSVRSLLNWHFPCLFVRSIADTPSQGSELRTELDNTFRSCCCTQLVLCMSFQHLGDQKFSEAIEYLALELCNINNVASWMQRR